MNKIRKMRKIIFVSLIAELYIVVICDYNFLCSSLYDFFTNKPAEMHVPIFQSYNKSEISCYHEISNNSGFQEYDPLEGKLLINLMHFYNISNFFNRNNIITNIFGR